MRWNNTFLSLSHPTKHWFGINCIAACLQMQLAAFNSPESARKTLCDHIFTFTLRMSHQPPRIKSRTKKIKSRNGFIACAARSPLDLGGRESPKTRGSLDFFFSRCGVKVDDDGEYIINYDNTFTPSSFLRARRAPPSQL